jgi:hypothetical protein
MQIKTCTHHTGNHILYFCPPKGKDTYYIMRSRRTLKTQHAWTCKGETVSESPILYVLDSVIKNTVKYNVMRWQPRRILQYLIFESDPRQQIAATHLNKNGLFSIVHLHHCEHQCHCCHDCGDRHGHATIKSSTCRRYWGWCNENCGQRFVGCR